MTKGEIPITKNVNVVDSQGNKYEATYPKRAQGLVKKGRARFIDENTICLACPPNEYLEDNKMENTTVKINNGTITEKDILEALNKMQDNMAYVNDALAKLETVRSDGPEDIGAQAKAKAMSDVVMCHETTNQKMIALYEKMYDDVRKTDEERKADIAKNTFSELTLKIDKLDMRPQDKISAVLEITESIKEVLLQLMTE